MKDKKKTQTQKKKPVPVYKNFLYLVPGEISAGAFEEKLDFLSPETMEVWKEIDILEITVGSRTITFESIQDQLYPEDLKLLDELSVKQVYTCEYAEEDHLLMQKIMKTLMDAFGGKIGSDTEDFQPFLKAEQL